MLASRRFFLHGIAGSCYVGRAFGRCRPKVGSVQATLGTQGVKLLQGLKHNMRAGTAMPRRIVNPECQNLPRATAYRVASGNPSRRGESRK